MLCALTRSRLFWRMHTQTHAFLFLYTRAHTHVRQNNSGAFVFADRVLKLLSYAYSRLCIPIYTYIHTHMHTRATLEPLCSRTRSWLFRRMHTHMHAFLYIHTYTHICTPEQPRRLCVCRQGADSSVLRARRFGCDPRPSYWTAVLQGTCACISICICALIHMCIDPYIHMCIDPYVHWSIYMYMCIDPYIWTSVIWDHHTGQLFYRVCMHVCPYMCIYAWIQIHEQDSLVRIRDHDSMRIL